jgi:hypothetical protein
VTSHANVLSITHLRGRIWKPFVTAQVPGWDKKLDSELAA